MGVGFHPYFTVGTSLINEAEAQLPGVGYLEFNERLAPTGSIVDVAARRGIIASFVRLVGNASTIAMCTSNAMQRV